jgi:hypothetical protein
LGQRNRVLGRVYETSVEVCQKGWFLGNELLVTRQYVLTVLEIIDDVFLGFAIIININYVEKLNFKCPHYISRYVDNEIKMAILIDI